MTQHIGDEADQINVEAWSDDATLKWFRKLEGWSDPGEQAALSYISISCAGVPVLDIGVGAGRTVPMLRALSSDYRAIDFSQGMVDVCRSKYPGLDVTFGDARDLGRYGDGSFGLVVFSWNGIDAVDHEDRQVILREVRRVLRTGGIFFFSTHNKSGPGHNEKPWTIRANDFAHLRHLAEVVAYFPRNLRNHRRNRGLDHDAGEWSMMNAAAHNFGIVIHYITLRQEFAELVEAGFQPDPVVFESRRGNRVRPGDDTRRSWWFHLLATA